MMTTHQLKAARALLDWTQQDLAKSAGMHLNVINNIERGITNPRQQTIERLKKTLEDNGIQFIGSRGVELVKQAVSVTKLEGESFLKALTSDILGVAKGKGDEVLSILADMRNFDTHDPIGNKKYYEEKAARGFKERLITRAMPGFYPRHSESYRVVDASFLGPVDTVIYADRTARIFWSQQEVLVLKSADLAQTERRTFEALWASGAEPVRAVRAAED
ncbi:MAG: helix-turn-helix domain-containing protein [Alphaproteobacteria bacterium]|nr:helix-turn-helix domain-containing protein [Alphaproteobacteria bacterium]